MNTILIPFQKMGPEPASALRAAEFFLAHETQFRLGELPTEQSHPKTQSFSQVIQASTEEGVRLLQSVDQDLIPMADRVFSSASYARLQRDLLATLRRGGRICFSGCGATGRLAILLEASWRRFWRETAVNAPDLAAAFPHAGDRVVSLMTGGDFALVRSVEFFEDYQEFGREQVRELGLKDGDLLVAISEGGETSSVIGTVHEALARGVRAHFVCNNPLETLGRLVERSRAIIEHPAVNALGLATGPMAIAGSTRMQATSAELLVVGCALESALHAWVQERRHGGRALHPGPSDGPALLRELLASLSDPENVKALSNAARAEADTYRNGGAITYFARDLLLDCFTDTTERSPTFMLPPFRRRDDTDSARPWTFVKHASLPTEAAWLEVYGHPPRCLNWAEETYHRLGAPERAHPAPPRLTAEDLMQFAIGSENDPSRYEGAADSALGVFLDREAHELTLRDSLQAATRPFTRKRSLILGGKGPSPLEGPCEHVAFPLAPSPLRLGEHIAAKLVLNTLSTAAMGLLGRVEGNWMVHVDTSNKKLLDRGTRIISSLAGLPYEEACRELFHTRAELAQGSAPGPKPSPVARTLERLAQTKRG